jgi:hypothetical protein
MGVHFLAGREPDWKVAVRSREGEVSLSLGRLYGSVKPRPPLFLHVHVHLPVLYIDWQGGAEADGVHGSLAEVGGLGSGYFVKR